MGVRACVQARILVRTGVRAEVHGDYTKSHQAPAPAAKTKNHARTCTQTRIACAVAMPQLETRFASLVVNVRGW